MTSLTGFSPENPRRYEGANVYLAPVVTRNRAPTGADYRQPETGKLYAFNTFWLIGKNPTTGSYGELYYLSKIVANVAFWVKLGESPTGPLLDVTVQSVTAPGVNPVTPDGTGNMVINGSIVANQSIPIQTHTSALNTYDVEVQYADTAAVSTANQSGMSHYNAAEFTVDSVGFVSLVNNSSVGVSNIAFSYSAGVFTVHGKNGTALSATNPGYVTIQSKASPSNLVTVAITANQTFIDSTGVSTIIGNLFGLTTGIAYATDVPFFLYAVLNDSENAISFMISRFPNTYVSPVSAKIGKTGSAVANSQGSFFALSNPTVTDYDGNSCMRIGSFRMQMNSSDDWSVFALSGLDGMGRYFENTQFALLPSQFGAASGSLMKGLPPTFSTIAASYIVTASNFMYFTGILQNCTVNGGDANSLSIAAPYLVSGGTTGSGRASTTGANTLICITTGTSGNNNNTLFFYSGASADLTILNNDFTPDAGDLIIWNVSSRIVFT